MQRWRQASIVGLVTGFGSTLTIVGVLAAGGEITAIFAVEAAVAVVNLLWTSVLARRALAQVGSDGAPDLDAAEWVQLRRAAAQYGLAASYGVVLTLLVWRRSELLFLEAWSTETEIAIYSVAFAIVTALA